VSRRQTVTLLALASLCALGAAGCQSEEKVLKYNPFLANIPGAETKTKPVGERFDNYIDPTKLEGDKTVLENPDGSVTLVAKSVRHLMTNITLCLQYEDDELLLDQVISEQTKGRFRGEGKEPEEAVKFLKENQKDISALFARMPFGEHSPNIILKQPARRTVVLELTGLAAKDMRFTELWAVMEKGDWKLLWIR
jgi:hypothetical protein